MSWFFTRQTRGHQHQTKDDILDELCESARVVDPSQPVCATQRRRVAVIVD